MKLAMKHDELQQLTLSNNIANANTPKYKAKEVKDLDFGNMLKSSYLNLNTTSHNHINGKKSGASFKVVKQEDAYETTPTGNNVVLEQQMLKLNANNTHFQLASGMYKKFSTILRAAINGLK
jgi:flagellar basal-body rod protein FlgB